MTAQYELIRYPTDGRFSDKDLAGTFTSTEDAMAATEYPNGADWQVTGTASFIVTDEVMEKLGRDFSPYLIQPSRARAVALPDVEVNRTAAVTEQCKGER